MDWRCVCLRSRETGGGRGRVRRGWRPGPPRIAHPGRPQLPSRARHQAIGGRRARARRGGGVISLRRWIRVVGMLIVFAPNVLPAQDPSIVAPGAKLERLFDEGFFTEGPTQAPDGSVYFSDITVGKASGNQAGHIWRWDPRTRTTAVFRSPSGMSNGMVFDGQGRLVVAEGAAVRGPRVTPCGQETGQSVVLPGLFDRPPVNSPDHTCADV